MSDNATGLPPVGAELISVQIGGQLFAIDIMSVREIRGWTASTKLPHSPAHVLGMINLRGSILPVVDLGLRLGIVHNPPDSSSVVIVAQIGETQVGLLVDAVCDILTVMPDMIQEPPDIGVEAVRGFVRGVMTIETGIVSLLCLDNVLPNDIAAVAA